MFNCRPTQPCRETSNDSIWTQTQLEREEGSSPWVEVFQLLVVEYDNAELVKANEELAERAELATQRLSGSASPKSSVGQRDVCR